MTTSNAVNVLVYRWAGAGGPFKVSIPCGECALTHDVINDTIENELNGIAVNVTTLDWLDHWWPPLLKGGWHAPIVMVEGRIISQGAALNRGILTQAVIESHAIKKPIKENIVFSKSSCPYCVKAKHYLDSANVAYQYYDVVREPRALYEMLARVKPIIGAKTPVTVPQIWMDGQYVGGADQLSEKLHTSIEPNPDRGQCSMSPAR